MRHYAVLDVIYLPSVVVKIEVKLIWSFVHGWIMFPVFGANMHIQLFFQNLSRRAH